VKTNIYKEKLKKRFKEDEKIVDNISVPTHPIAAVVRGATLYGLGFYSAINNSDSEDIQCILTTRVLKFTYGIKIFETWRKSDPIERRTPKGEIIKFLCVAKRGEEIEIDKEKIVEKTLGPNNPLQTIATFYVYHTREHDAKYCDEPGMELLGKLKTNLPDVHLGYNRSLTFGLSFGKMEIKATARNANGQTYLTTFEIDREND